MNRRQTQRGSALLESAVAILVLCGIAFGAFYLGWSMLLYERLVAAVAGAGRYAARVDLDAGNTAFPHIRNMAVSGNPNDASNPLAPGLTTANIQVTRTDGAGGVPASLTIAVVGYSSNLGVATFRAEGKPAVTVRWAGVYKW